MTTKRELISVLLVLHSTLLQVTSGAEVIGIYWGANGNEGSLAEIWATGRYSYVNIAFLNKFGDWRTPELSLSDHCDPQTTGSCNILSDEVQACQNRSIKVMLSMGGHVGNYNLSSRDDTRNLSVYLWNNFLGGTGGSSSTRPLGEAVLDGIDLAIGQGSNQYYGYLVNFLKSYSNNGRKVYVTGAPSCEFPDYYLEAAFKTTPSFDYVWVSFYGNPRCDYSSANNFFNSWEQWTKSNYTGKIFLGLPAAPAVDKTGFIPAEVLKTKVLPRIQRSDKYGGLMLWSAHFDRQSGYSVAIQTSIPPVQSPSFPPQNNDGDGNHPPSGYDGSDPRNSSQTVVGVMLGITGWVIVSIIMIICCCLKRLCSTRGPDHETNQDVEKILLQHGSLTLKRYKYSEIKKITKSFSDKLGQGGYGSVYKGILRDGSLVAVKVLIDEMNSNGEEFINEVASISRTSHVNIVNLLGFCLDKNKRALVYEFMSNKSLDNFISRRRRNNNNNNNADCHELDLEKLYEIAVGVAKGLEYLHSGCNTRIIHFDIKPQNILLDEDFCPKISDFGLAKLCKKKQSILSMLGTRGTIGYIAPEIFSRNFGGVSHKSDVYSYGMMILEMAGARKIEEEEEEEFSEATNSSQNYFPDKIYKHVILNASTSDQISLDGTNFMQVEDQENEKARKMLLIGFWCIQTTPSDRPPMSKIVEMLEGRIQSIQIPPKPTLFCANTLSPQDISPTLSELYAETEISSA